MDSKTYLNIKQKIENPLWKILPNGTIEEPKYIHNWEAYIPTEYKMDWNNLYTEFKMGMYVIAEIRADSEEWD